MAELRSYRVYGTCVYPIHRNAQLAFPAVFAILRE